MTALPLLEECVFRQPGEGIGGSFQPLCICSAAPTVKNAILSSHCLSKFYFLNMCPAITSWPVGGGGLERVGSVRHTHPQTLTEPLLGLGSPSPFRMDI